MPFLLDHAYSYFIGLGAFAFFIVIIARYGVKPLLRTVDARDEKLRADLDASRAAAARAQENEKKLAQRLGEVELTVAEMLREAREEADRFRDQAVADGQEEVERARQKSLKAIEAARHAALLKLRDEMAEIATEAAGRIIAAELDPERHRDLVAEVVARIDARETG